ncbi:MAG: hypothetical protein GC138_00820 [Gammaproteobacteria bacterium]|nr:hypothetical protein [Gammaproteobacteria bacterium]
MLEVEMSSTCDRHLDHREFCAFSGISVAIFVLAVLFIGWIFFSDISQLIYFFSDDAYYYFKVAENITLGKGVTFDGYNMSNGFHPLWMLILVAVYGLVKNPELALRVAITIQVFLAVGSIMLCRMYLLRVVRPSIADSGVLVLLALASPVVFLFNGLESGLLMFWVWLTLYVGERSGLLASTASRNQRVLLGALLGTMLLIRLDTAFILIALAIFKLVFPQNEGKGAGRLQYLARFYAPTIAVFACFFAPYLIWNYDEFGHLTPISGALKSSFPNPMFAYHFSSHVLPYLTLMILSGAWVIVSALATSGRMRGLFAAWKTDSRYMLFSVFWLGCSIHLLWTQCFMAWGVYQWHFAAYMPVLTIFTALALEALVSGPLRNRSSLTAIVQAGVLVVVAAFSYFLYIQKGAHHQQRIEAAHWADAHLPRDAALALSDAGVFAYFNDRHTLNLDGLINSYEYQDAMIEGTIPTFFERQHVKFLADAYTECDYDNHAVRIAAYPGRFGLRPGYVFHADRQAEVYRSEPEIYWPLTKKMRICFVIWDMRKVAVERIS